MTLYCEKPEWKDIVGLPQNDGPEPLCPINYTAEFRDCMDYFRAILRRDERSQRALALTADVIEMNPANYTAWHFRRLCLTALGCDLAKELDEFVFELAPENPKNYQMWHHRRACTEKICAAIVGGDAAAKSSTIVDAIARADATNLRALQAAAKRELDFCLKQLLTDAKNLHAWSHRQWLVAYFGVWAGELAFIDKLIDDDLRNNSAWNHRFFVVTSSHLRDASRLSISTTSSWTTPGDAAASTATATTPPPPPTTSASSITRLSECEYALQYINKAPNNSAPWAYLRGLLLSPKAGALPLSDGATHESLVDDAYRKCGDVQRRAPACPHALALALELVEWRRDRASGAHATSVSAHSALATMSATEIVDLVPSALTADELRAAALRIVALLETQQDCTHANYWRYRREQIK
jgi:hypothetical protein